jgi:hypothetical protein
MQMSSDNGLPLGNATKRIKAGRVSQNRETGLALNISIPADAR